MLQPAHVGHLSILRSLIRDGAARGSFDRELATDSREAALFFSNLRQALNTGYFVEEDPRTGDLTTVAVPGYVYLPDRGGAANQPIGFGLFKAIDFGFVAGKWANPLWQVWDLLMLWLAMLHGTNGLRTIINDYAEKDQTRFWLKALLITAALVIVVLGTLVIFTFDPCLDPNSTLSVCK